MQNLNTQMDTTIKKMEALLQSVSKTADGLQKIGLSAKQLVQYEKELQGATEQTNAARKQKQSIEQQIANQNERLSKLQSKEQQELTLVTEKIRQQNVANKQRAREMLAAAGSIDQLSARLQRLRRVYDALSESRRNGSWGQAFQKEIERIDNTIKQSDFATGRFQRNVGNYASAFNPLQFQIQQVARELPSLTMSAQQFFLAISNNLPMLADELGRAQAKNEALRKSGEKTVPVWKQIVGGILSWQTALVVGITLMTAYGKQIGEWVKGLFAGRAAAISMTDALKNMNEAMDFKDLGGQIADFKKLQSAWVALGGDVEKQKKFLVENREELDKTGIAVMDIVDAENLFVKNSEAYITALTLRAKAAAGMKLASEEYEKAIQAQTENADDIAKYTALQNAEQQRLNDLIAKYGKLNAPVFQNQIYASKQMLEFYKSRVQALQDESKAHEENADAYLKASGKISKAERDTLGNANLETTNKQKQKEAERAARQAEKEAERNAKALEKIRQASYKASMEMARNSQAAQAEVNKAIATDEQMSYEARKGALNAYVEYQKRSVQTAADAQIEALIQETIAAQNGIDTREQAEKELAAQIQLIRQKAGIENQKIEREGAKSAVEIEKSRADAQIQEIMRVYEARRNDTNTAESNELRDLSAQYSQGLMKAEEYEAKKTEISRKYANQRFDDEISLLEEQLLAEGISQEDFNKILEQIGLKRIEYNKFVNDQIIADNERRAQKEEELETKLAQRKQQLIADVFNFAKTLGDSLFESELNRLDRESEANKQWADKERKRIEEQEEAGVFLKEDAVNKKKAIDETERERIKDEDELEVLSKEEAAAKKKAIDEAEAQKEKELEQQRADLRKRQAIFEKALAIAQIIQETARAIAKIQLEAAALRAIPVVGDGLAAKAMAQIPWVIASSAVQMATIAATPIPQYAQGTDNHPGGLAVVGDGGRPEVIATPRGEFFMTPAISTLVDLPAQSIVYPTIYDAMAEMPALPFKNIQANKVDYSKELLFRTNEQSEIIRGTNRMLRQLIYEVKQERERQDYYYKKSQIVHPRRKR